MAETKDSDKANANITNDSKKLLDKEDLNTINSLKSKENDIIVAHYTKNIEDPESPPVERVKFEGLSDDSICSDESEDEELPPIPDGGWGWVVVLSAFLVSACADGLAFSFGLLQKEFVSHFEVYQYQASMVGSLFIATPLLAGPIMSALVDRYGCRVMTMIAGVLSTIGFLLAAISNSIQVLCLTFGFLTGLAMGILYVTAVVSVAFWFDKRRNLAVSLASCGIGFGTLVYSPLTKYLLEEFGWRYTILLLAGTLLNMCVCGAVMRDPDWLKIKQRRERRLSKSRSRKSSSAGSISSRSIGGESIFLSPDELKCLLKSGKSPDYILETLATTIAEAEELEATTQMNAEQNVRRMHSALHLPTFIQHNEKVPPEVIEKLMENKRLYNIILQNFPDLVTRRRSEINLIEGPPPDAVIEPAKLPVNVKIKSHKDKVADKESKVEENENINNSKALQDKPKHKPHNDAKDHSTKLTTHNLSKHEHDKENKTNAHERGKSASKEVHNMARTTSWVRQISMDHHYFRDIPLYRNTMMHRGAMMNIPRYKLRALSLPDMYRNSMWSLASSVDEKWYHRALETLKATFDMRMFTEFHFLMFNVSSLILSIWFIVPYYYLKDFMDAQHLDGGEMMISIIGIASSVGIVSLGWAGDQPWINVTKTYAICLILCGVSVFIYPVFITHYWALTIISAVFGLSFASSYSYTPTILMELMPIDHFTVAYGLILLSQGIGHLVGPPIASMLFDVTGTWDLTFYMGGGWLVVSGVFVGVIAYTKDARICGSAPLLKEADDAEKAEVDV